jgi:UDPglucose--hexose-1-phosphate uridylyltransferase
VRAHDAHWSTLGAGEIERILALYREREAQALADGHAYVAVFKNSGAAAGASLHHPHSQVVALRRIPLSVEARIGRLIAPCDVCGAAADASERRVADFGEIVSFVPDGSRSGFEVRIAPRAHMARFSDWTADLWPVAAAVADAVERLGATLGEQVPFNAIVQSAARDRRAEAYGHWEIEIIPRIENVGGYELGTGGFLVSRLPEEAARILRAVRLARDA